MVADATHSGPMSPASTTIAGTVSDTDLLHEAPPEAPACGPVPETVYMR
jgi:hypothetical protein